MIKIGPGNLFSLEGNTQLLDGGALYGNAPKEMWKKWHTADVFNRIPLACRSLLLKVDGLFILFEAGIGAFFEPKLKERYGIQEEEHILLKSLQKIGLDSKDIDFVVLSHLHFDHAGGLLNSFKDGANSLLFPKARYIVGAEQWKRAQQPHLRDRASYIPKLHQLLKDSGRLILVQKEGYLPELPKYISFQISHGHTPGMLISLIYLEDKVIAFCSDLIVGFPWVHIPLTTGYDRFAELVIDEKKRLLDYLLQKNGLLFFTHDINHSFGIVKKDENEKYFAVPFLSSI